jgi:hypothetical protein
MASCNSRLGNGTCIRKQINMQERSYNLDKYRHNGDTYILSDSIFVCVFVYYMA